MPTVIVKHQHLVWHPRRCPSLSIAPLPGKERLDAAGLVEGGSRLDINFHTMSPAPSKCPKWPALCQHF